MTGALPPSTAETVEGVMRKMPPTSRQQRDKGAPPAPQEDRGE